MNAGCGPRRAAAGCARFAMDLHDQRAAGFTLIELIVVIVLISIISSAGAERLLYYEERAEKASMESTLAAIKTGLQVRLAELLLTNRQSAAAELEAQNPMHWLAEPPANFCGDYRVPAKSGCWYFAAAARQLAYVPSASSHMRWTSGLHELRFSVRLKYDEVEAAGARHKVPTGIAMVAAEPYRWF